jgi:acetyl-CoA synthetase
MLACARLGVIHSEVFGAFSGAACGERITDSGSRILLTMEISSWTSCCLTIVGEW